MSRSLKTFWFGLALLALALQGVLIQKVVDLGQQVQDLRGQVDDLSSQADGDGDTLDQTQAAIDTVRSEFEALKASVGALDRRHDEGAVRDLKQATVRVDAALQEAEDALDPSPDDGGDAAPLATRLPARRRAGAPPPRSAPPA